MKMKNPPPGSIGLCFSGGGFRASLFHLGVLRYLAETKQLSNVGVISSVSGGSIIAAFLASRWGTLQKDKFSLIDDVVEELRNPRASSDLIAHSLPEQLVNEVQRIRTDLDNFLPEEAKLLSYHSYQLTHTLLTIYYDSEKIKNHPVSIKEPQWKLKFTKNKLKRYNKTLWRCDKRFAWKRRPW